MKKLLLGILFFLCFVPSAFSDSEITISGATSSSHLIQEEGVTLRPRPYLNFTGSGATCTDLNGITTCAITGGSSSGAGDTFKTWDLPAGDNIVADSTTDTVTFTGSNGLSITGTGASDTIAFGLTLSGDATIDSAGSVGISSSGGIEVETVKQQTVTVAKAGGDYTTIQGAINSISDNATAKRYVVLIYPGVYTENVVMEEYVSLVGFDHETTEITSASGTTVTAPPNTSDASISNLTLTSTPTVDGGIVLLMTAGELDVYDSYIKQTSATAGVEGKLIDLNAGELKLDHCYLNYDLDGSAAPSAQQHNIIDVLASATTELIMQDCDYFADIADTDDIAKSINVAHAAGETAVLYINNNRFKQNMSGAYTGTCSWIYSLADGDDIHLISNSLHLTSALNGTAYGILLNSDGDAGFMHSTANHIQIEDFATNYGLSVAGGDTFSSHFDDVVAGSGNTGLGTIKAVQSPSDGNFVVSGTITNSGLTASEMVITDASKVLSSAAVATYPSLTELSYVKDVTSAIQTQINAKGAITGQAWTGTHDFGGSILEIPNGATVTDPASVGQVAIDSTSDQFLYYGTAQRVLTYKYEDSKTVENIAAADDSVPFGSKSYARVVTHVGCRCIGTCTTKAEFSFSDSAANAFTLSATPTCATTGAATYVTVNSGGALIAGEGMLFNVTNSVSPETDWYEIMFVETVTAD